MAASTKQKKVTLSVAQLSSNSPDEFLSASKILLKFATNILFHPDEVKFRSIRLGNPVIQNKLLTVDGAMEILFDMGFQEQREEDFLARLKSTVKHVQLYEDKALQEKARAVIPIERLTKQAEATVSAKLQKSTMDVRDFLLLELLEWFKEDFFSWMDSPDCSRCGSTTRSVGSGQPTLEDLLWGAQRVEAYQCTTCSQHERFPRYNHPGKLLETRTGRCGEWANCFTLCCRALDFDARYVVDATDHVWTEVYSDSQGRWLHCDPCENKLDTPLMYEVGWRKQLTYVIAYSKDEVQDVTWRYSADHAALLTRRRDVPEDRLLAAASALTRELQAGVSDDRRRHLERCKVSELVEFLSPRRAADDAELGGRLSGAAAWRAARGEAGRHSGGHVFTPERATELRVRYDVVADEYRRSGAAGEATTTTRGWEACVYEASGARRKTERDWKMAYLTRVEGADEATVSWKVDCAGTGLTIDYVSVKATSKTFETGRVTWQLCSADQCAMLQGGKPSSVPLG
ncbi:PREDICTED: peptide-N(4)-(N-acetyl-beta-glucosaminyl)asparagine amidase-like isoform X2 [Priapulus caudatus]|uniref:Peptide-N(4)-(N-acetyl-beta-glucosaminyl)asparagine amidase n=1 Tax=Priapulus caudatus TaxID=37621 RepID=A0ABM1DSC5_PRICU|nr:PREDICTED: peptide-N(4)-(N-acetyl-beta-glucosaminyl)asparagine amidase-like isoform X2 [Priapulus caudatus]